MQLRFVLYISFILIAVIAATSLAFKANHFAASVFALTMSITIAAFSIWNNEQKTQYIEREWAQLDDYSNRLRESQKAINKEVVLVEKGLKLLEEKERSLSKSYGLLSGHLSKNDRTLN